MKIIELDIMLPYDKRGKILIKLCDRIRGRIKDIHFFPPTTSGMSRIRMEIETENAQRLLQDIKGLIKDGKMTFKVLAKA